MMGTILRLLGTMLCNCTFNFSRMFVLPCTAAPLSFRSEPLSTVQRLGGVVRLRCSARPSTARLSWHFRGQPLDPSSTPGVRVRSGSLALPSLEPSQEGPYQCVAHSDSGAIASRLAHVSIASVSEFAETRRRSLTVNNGSTALIKCQIPYSNPPALPRLRVRGEWLEQSTNEYLILPSGNLQIMSVSPQHQGTYKCAAYNPVTQEVKVEAHGTKLTVKDNPFPAQIIFPTTPQAVSVMQSESLTLECVVSQRLSTTVRWTKDGKTLQERNNYRLSHDNLVLPAVKKSDKGSYQCSFHVESGDLVSANYTVNVLEPASVLQGLTDQSVFSGSSVRFVCIAKGNPAPKVTWLFNSRPIPPSSRFQMFGSSLRIDAVTLQDQGIYQCLLDNGIGSAQSAGALTVLSAPLQSTTLGLLPDSPRSLHPVQSDEGEEALFLEEGLQNGVGMPTERTGDLPAPEAPIITSPPQTHKPDVYDLEWRAGRDWGSPISAYFVKYRKLDDVGNVVGSWHTVRVPGSEKTLRLSELEPSSLYEVLMVARSGVGDGQPAMLTFRTGKERSTSSSKNPSKAPFVSQPEEVPKLESSNTRFGVVIHDRVPEAPDRPTISMATESSVYVTWIPRANGGSPITAFRVEYRRQGRSADWLAAADNISPLKLSVEVRSLEPGSAYRFRVIAMNTYGESPPSAPSRFYQVSAASPPFPSRPVAGPHISSTDAVSDTQIMLRWTYTPSSNNNTPIQGFYIYYRPTDSDNDSDYKRDVVEGLKQWHLIGQLQPETSYDIKMQCFNDGGESEYSNVMICETKARSAPGAAPMNPVTPPGQYPLDPPTPPGGLLYLIVGTVLGVMVLILLVFIAMCLWRNRQQNSMHKFDPPGYLYPPPETNGHMLEYTTLPSTGHINGTVHGSYGHRSYIPPPGCPHLHHKLPKGLALLNGSGALYAPGHPQSHTHNGSLPHGTLEHECTPSSLPHNGGGLYSAVPQSDPSDCMSCQNFCNNNRCYKKMNGSFTNGAVPMHRAGPCQQEGLEMMPLGQVTPRCHTPSSPQCLGEDQRDVVHTKECVFCPLYPHPCHAEEDLQCEDPEGAVLCWDSLDLPEVGCKEKGGWMTTAGHMGEIIAPGLQET
uniref:Cell adhesion associated, oncogene regulated n=1 Tax=Scleropages formosus TaxID=113540 RepID=A0A8C9T4C6_SCLFO